MVFMSWLQGLRENANKLNFMIMNCTPNLYITHNFIGAFLST